MSPKTPIEGGTRSLRRRGRNDVLRLRRCGRAAASVARDPVEGVERMREKIADVRQRRRGPASVEAETSWEPALHALLGVEWPCPDAEAFAPLWSETIASVGGRGLAVGRGAYGGWDDADPGLARAIWCLARHLEPVIVVETGVARGFTTRVVLEALEANGAGHLCSIDLPPPLGRRRLEEETGAAVPARVKRRWTLVEGSSRRRLAKLLDELGTIDLFIHDSRHTYRNLSFELTLAWRALNPGGFLLADDVHCNAAFDQSVRTFRRPPALVCASDDAQGMFGVIKKPDRPARAPRSGKVAATGMLSR